MKLTGHRCKCAGCGQYFARTSTFDKHRTGDYATGRRCMSVEELNQKGFRQLSNLLWIGIPSLRIWPKRTTSDNGPVVTKGAA